MKSRRNKAEISRLADAMKSFAGEYPTTVRHLFYRLVGAGLIEKEEAEYKNVVVRLCGQLRESGEIPFDQIVDQSRRILWRQTYGNAGDALGRWARLYREPVWDALDVQPIVTIEKEAISGHFDELCEDYDVPLFPLKGFSSKTFLMTLAKLAANASNRDRLPVIFMFGDYDPSGIGAINALQDTVTRYWGNLADERCAYRPRFIKLAVDEAQIESFNLPTRPVKKSDTRAKGWTGGCVELDAMVPRDLQRILEDALNELLPPGYISAVRRREETEIEKLMNVATTLNQAEVA